MNFLFDVGEQNAALNFWSYANQSLFSGLFLGSWITLLLKAYSEVIIRAMPFSL